MQSRRHRFDAYTWRILSKGGVLHRVATGDGVTISAVIGARASRSIFAPRKASVHAEQWRGARHRLGFKMHQSRATGFLTRS